jgi:hypothetical protein
MGRWGWQTISKWENGRWPIPKDMPGKLAAIKRRQRAYKAKGE